MYGKLVMTCLKYQVYLYLYGSETIAYLNAFLNIGKNFSFILNFLPYSHVTLTIMTSKHRTKRVPFTKMTKQRNHEHEIIILLIKNKQNDCCLRQGVIFAVKINMQGVIFAVKVKCKELFLPSK